MEKIKFKDLSNWLKASLIFVWIIAGYYALAILIGVILAITDNL
jgi:ABC-type phosphate transport system auxiliary subunit